jgi:hypothetical protein
MREKRITKENEPEKYIELPFLEHSNDYAKCLNSFNENIPKVVKENPGISTKEVMDREMSRMRKYTGMAKESIRHAFTIALASNLGETIQCLGKTRKIEGRNYQQLTLIFKA